jgi:integrase
MKVQDAVVQYAGFKEMVWCPRQRERFMDQCKPWLRRWGAREVQSVSPAEIEELEVARSKEIKPSTLNAEGMQLKAFFRYAMKHGWRQDNPAADWKARKCEVDEEYYQVLCPEDEQKLLAAVSREWQQLIVTALYSGMRAGTLRKLRYEWFSRLSDVWQVKVPGKAMKMGRPLEVPVSGKIVQVLGLNKRSPDADQGLVFPWMPARPQDLSHAFKRETKRAKVNPRLKFHDLRRSFATRLLDKGVPMPTVMRLGGWTSMDVMLRRYLARLEAEKGREALEKLEEL